MTIGQRIRFCREQKKITQTELAERIGTTKQNIYKYENGIITNIPSDKIQSMANVLGVTPAYLMGWTDDAIKTHELLKTLHNPENTSEQVKEQDRFIDSIIKGTPIKKDRSAVIERINDLPDDQYEKFAERLEGYLDGLEDQ